MAIAQEVAENIARNLNEALGEGSTRPAEVFFLQPSEANNPEVAQSNPSSAPYPTPAPSPAPGVDASQTGVSATEIGDLPHAIPTVIRDSLPVPFTSDDLEKFRQYFSIPPSVEIRLLVDGDMIFFSCHNVSHSGWLTSLPAKRSWNNFADPKIDKVVEDRWHSKWFFVKGSIDEAVPRVWVPLGDAARPVKPKKMSATIRAQLETLRRVFDIPLHYKVFCEEGVLIQEGLIQSKEFDPTSGPPFCWGILFPLS
ncbi:hypothetical protein LIER_27657 [Lithospermum erythrorhizon]|uniref:Uncharacterized protein n=1 Tax=Lithospermum erythrorhizon TaxID=34254 RepID=A0AAV3RGE3_LITER